MDVRKLIKCSLENVVVSDDVYTSKKVGGSANIKLNENGLPFRCKNISNTINKHIGKTKVEVLMCFNGYQVREVIRVDSQAVDYLVSNGYVKKIGALYKLNKSKLRSKILAYSQLKKSRKFMAFYSISFPSGLADSYIRTVHNTVLTRIRKTNKSFSYIWVAERQKNGTLHFHMLTNTFFNVRIINHMYKKAIQNIIKKYNLSTINFKAEKYNGVDVKPVKNVQLLSKYLSKYVTKNNEKFNGLVWNCDSSVSSLITHIYLNMSEFNEMSKRLIYVKSITKESDNNFYNCEFDIYDYGSYRPKIIFETIREVNEYVLKWCQKPLPNVVLKK